jgi:hypothetical protein
MTMSTSMRTAMGVALILLGTAAAEARADLWLHVKVRESGGDGSRVSISLPLAVVEAAAPLLPAEARTAARLRVGNQDLSVADLRRIWRQVRSAPDATFITVDDASGQVRVARQGASLVIRAVDAGRHGDRVEVRIPAAVVDALLAGNDQSLDLAGAITALARSGEGELVTVNGDNDTVRMWVDSDAGSNR